MKPFVWINAATPERRVQAMKTIFVNQLIQAVAFGFLTFAIYRLCKECDALENENHDLITAQHEGSDITPEWLSS